MNWNGYKDTVECVKSLRKLNYSNYKTIVIDNGSDSDEIYDILNEYPEVVIIKSELNLGFSGGNNLGIKYSLTEKADYILLLNNDTVVEPDFLKPLVDAFINDDKLAIAVPKINYFCEPQIIWYAGGYISKFRSSGFTYGVGKNDNDYLEDKYVTFATGCCLLIKNNILTEIGLMDEYYFLYLEDVDYCKRVIQSNYRIKFVAKSKIYHKISLSTTRSNSLLPLYYITRNRLYFAKKFNRNLLPLVLLIILSIFTVKSLFWLLTGQKNKVGIVLTSIGDFLASHMGKRDFL